MAGGDQSRGSGRGLEQAKQVLYVCSSTAAHVIGITDPAMYRHNSQQAIELPNKELKRQREEWTVRLKSDGPEVGEE